MTPLPIKVIEEARRRLLEKHGAAIEGYLPKGAFKSKEELDFVRGLSKQQAGGGLSKQQAGGSTPKKADAV